MTPREMAQSKQIAAGNSPDNTRMTVEERMDFPCHVVTGKHYREQLNKRLAHAMDYRTANNNGLNRWY